MIQPKTYHLKAAVMARGLAEITVLLILVALPVVLLISKQFFLLHIVVKTCVCVLSPLSVLGLWGMCKIPFRIKVDDTGLQSRSISKQEIVKWSDIKAVKQGMHFGLKQYVLSHSGGEFVFPALMNGSLELVSTIRSSLPNRGRTGTAGDAQTFKVSKIAFLFELGKLFLQIGFVMLFIWFAGSTINSRMASKEDMIVVSLAAAAFVGAIGWKFFQLMRLVQKVSTDERAMTVTGLLGHSVSLPWETIEMVVPASVFYPDGIILNAAKKKYLIGSIIDGFDEICEELALHVKKSDQKLPG